MPTLSRGLIVPDVHRPYHDRKAWRLMLRAAKEFQPDWIWILGDFADCLAVSRHSKDPRRATQL
jgi:predicted phosphodiesterase